MELKVVIVESDFLNRMYLEKMVKEYGGEVIGLTDCGEEAIIIVKSFQPDCVILNLNLRGNSCGVQTAQKLKTFSNADIAFIVGDMKPEMLHHIDAINPIAMLEKPIQEMKLKQMCQELRQKHLLKSQDSF